MPACITYQLITEQQALDCLPADWAALTSDEQKAHIQAASFYVADQWDCTINGFLLDWNGDPATMNLPPVLVSAIAQYAYQDFLGSLNGQVSTTGPLRRKRVKAGPVESEKEYFANKNAANSSLGGGGLSSIDSMMKRYCSKSGAGSRWLTRV